jgi:hypothetical protein
MLRENIEPDSQSKPTLAYQARTASTSLAGRYLGYLSIACGAAALGLFVFGLIAGRYFAFFETHRWFLACFWGAPILLIPLGTIIGLAGCIVSRFHLGTCIGGFLVNLAAALTFYGFYLWLRGDP